MPSDEIVKAYEAEALIGRFTTSFDHAKYEDEYRKRLLKVVKRKRKGDEVPVSRTEERDEAPPDLFEALKASVEAARGSRNGRPARKSEPSSRQRRATTKR